MDPLDDLELLRTFVRIVDCGSISAAARALGMNQPTVSRRLQQLEAAAGVALLRRDTRTMSLTAAGRRLREDAGALLDLAEAATQRLRGDRDAVSGHLRIVSVVDLGQWIVARLLAEFREAHPAVTAELHFLNRTVKFAEEGFDCGILVGEVADPGAIVRPLAEVERWVVASPGYLARRPAPRRPADLSGHAWLGIVLPQYQARDRLTLMRAGRTTVAEVRPALLFDGVTATREAALAGAGVAVQPSWLVRDDVAGGRLVRLLSDWTVHPIAARVAYPAARVQPARVRAFVAFVQARMGPMLGNPARLGP